jgi:hypothetical protein
MASGMFNSILKSVLFFLFFLACFLYGLSAFNIFERLSSGTIFDLRTVPTAPEAIPVRDEDEYDTEAGEVYAVLLELRYGLEPRAVVEGTSYNADAEGNIPQSTETNTLIDFRAMNRESRSLKLSPEPLGSEVALIDRVEFPSKSFWRDFRRRFPETPEFVTFSNVGFNENRNQALVVMSTRRRSSFEETAFLLYKTKGIWRLQERQEVYSAFLD